jgi:branched-chain amino acid transport system permease protein
MSKRLRVAILIAAGLSVPFLTESTFIVHLLILSFLWAMMTAAYNLLMGYAGLLSLGHATFYAIGAYTSALMVKKLGVAWPVGMLCAALITGLVSALLGLFVLRLKGAYFAMVTFGLAEITRHVIENWEGLTGGVYGLIRIPPLFESIRLSYVFIFLLMVLVYLFIHRILRTGVGRALISIRENEALSRSAGINAPYYKRLAFVISAMICGVAGSASTHYLGFAYPEFAHFLHSASLLVYTVAGGPGYLLGPGVAAVFFTFLPEFSRSIGNIQLLVYGMVLIGVIVLVPGGLEPVLHGRWSKLKNALSVRRGA